jgi:hypothetical protein
MEVVHIIVFFVPPFSSDILFSNNSAGQNVLNWKFGKLQGTCFYNFTYMEGTVLVSTVKM